MNLRVILRSLVAPNPAPRCADRIDIPLHEGAAFWSGRFHQVTALAKDNVNRKGQLLKFAVGAQQFYREFFSSDCLGNVGRDWKR